MARDDECYTKAKKRGEWSFTLVAHDLTAPSVICEWIKQNIETASEEKLREALDDALIMRKHIGRRWPGRSRGEQTIPKIGYILAHRGG